MNRQLLIKPVSSGTPSESKTLRGWRVNNGSCDFSAGRFSSNQTFGSLVSALAPRRLGHEFSRMSVHRVANAVGCLRANHDYPRAAIQLQTATTPPKGVVEQQAGEEEETEAPEARSSEEIEDTGEGVASIEEGAPTEVPSSGEEERSLIQSKPDGRSVAPTQAVTTGRVLGALESGYPMGDGLKKEMEGFFGRDLSGVSIHTDRRAQVLASSLGAYAFTVGHKIAFAAGKYQPHTTEGRKLLGHELTHVIQQRHGLPSEVTSAGIGQPDDKFEVEADQVADRIAQQWAIRPLASPPVRVAIPGTPPDRSSVSRSAIQLFSGSKAAAYARKWATTTNPTYGRFGNDCTNFASQAMLDGGWSMVGGSYWDRSDNDVWWFGKSRFAKASYTWGGAENFYQFVNTSGRGTVAKRVMDLNVGDVLQMDFSGTGHRGHTMVVTEKTASNLFLSYHTSDHKDEPFYPDGTNPGILDRNPDPPTKYWGWNIV